MKLILLELGEPMSGSKLRGLHNHSYELRNLVIFGEILKNAVECESFIFVHNDVAQSLEQESRKNYLE